MKLNHDIYREAMENVRISDEVGKKLLENAAEQNKRHQKKWKAQMAAAIAGILLVGLGVNSICYAQTGKNVLEMFAALYEDTGPKTPSEDFSVIAEGAIESGETITHGNIRFTLEYYFYDRGNMEIFAAIRTDSLDGTPLDMERVRERYGFGIDGGHSGMGQCSDAVYSKSKTSAYIYCHYRNEPDGFGNPPDKIKMEFWRVVCDDSEEMKPNETYDTEEIGTFTLVNTGKVKTRYADCSSLGYQAKKARITGGGLSLRFQENIWKEFYMDDSPINVMEIKMADGTVYRYGYVSRYEKIPLYDSKGKLQNKEDFSAEDAEKLDSYVIPEKREEDGLPENVHELSGGYAAGKENGGFTDFFVIFDDFINVDDIVAVEVDGVEMPLE